MKFVCPSCKAKYQISDEKVAGRSVKMKCRKCGHVIHLGGVTTGEGSAARTTDTSPKTPAASPKPPHAGQRPAARPGSPTAPAASPKAPDVGAAKAGSAARLGGGAHKKPAPAAKPPWAAKSPAAELKSAPRRPPPPRSGPTSHVPRPARLGAAGGSLAPRPSAAPRPATGARLSAAAAVAEAQPDEQPLLQSVAAPEAESASSPVAERASQPHPVGVRSHDTQDEPARAAAAGGAGVLAGAFSHAVEADGAPAAEDTAEWHVGVNGTPVGPLRRDELGAKIAAGVISGDSLVWKDGFEEWKKLAEVPELGSLGAAETGAKPAAVADVSAAASAPIGVLADPFAVSPAGVPLESADTRPSVVSEAPDELALLGKRHHGTPKAAWIAVGVALLFGLTIGYVLFGGEQQKAAPAVAQADKQPGSPGAPRQPAAEAVAEERAAAPEPGEEAPTDTAAGQTAAVQKRALGTGAGTSKTGAKSGEKGGGLTGLAGLRGGTGPSSGPSAQSAGESTKGGGEPLDSASIQRTVSRYTTSVRRSCWQPALDTRDRDAPTTARVSASIQVAPSGRVQSVSTSGDPRGYRGLSSCIASKVRGWQFPASSGTTTVNVPFVFAAQ